MVVTDRLRPGPPECDRTRGSTGGPVTTPSTRHTRRPEANAWPWFGWSTLQVVLGVADLCGLVPAVATTDAALRARLLDVAALEALLSECAGLPGTPTVRAAAPPVDANAESAGESRARLVLQLLGYRLRSQVAITDGTRQVAGVDFLLEGIPVVIEFDGDIRYGGGDARVLV